jgi:asparagine synthase (glutamine-hydrolysing)
MMHSLEARCPFLDRDLAEFAARLPTSMKVRGLSTKYILKRAFEGIVPRANLRRGKQGFAVPIGAWFRGELREFLTDHLRPARLAAAGLVRQAAVDILVDDHTKGTADHAHELWTLLMLELWYREFATR